jgi:PEP-CTERM motif
MNNLYKNTFLAIALSAAMPLAHATSVDFTGATGNSATINGAIFSNPANLLNTGSGTLDPFVRIGSPGNSDRTHGYNTDGTRQFDELNGVFTHSLQLGNIGGETIGSTSYRVFILDINEPSSNPRALLSLLSLDELEIYLGNTPSPTGYDTLWSNPPATTDGFNAPGTDADLVYSLDDGINNSNEILLNADFTNGSGLGFDMKVLIPDALFAGKAATDYLYLYSHFGGKSGDYGDQGGFQEWAALRGQFTPPRNNVPEPAALLLLATGMLGMLAKTKRKSA